MGSTLIGFTEKTSYSYLPKTSPYDTYRVVAVYKGYSGIQSESAVFTLKNENEVNPSNFALTYNGSTIIPADGSLLISTSNLEATYNSSSSGVTIKSCAPQQISTAGKHTITCTVTYDGKDYSVSTTITTTKEESPPEENSNP